MKYLKYLMLFMCSAVFAQSPQQLSNVGSIQWITPIPSGPTQVSASVHGTVGSNVLYYWVIADFTGGNSKPSESAVAYNVPITLSETNYVTISWNSVKGATGYDVIKSSTPNYSTSGSIALIKNTQNLTVNDTGQALTSYTFNTFNPQTCSWYVDSTTSSTPNIITPCLVAANSGIQPTGGTNYIPWVTSGTISTAATQNNLLSILGTPYNSLSGNGNLIGTITGPTTSGNCVSFDAFGNLVASGGGCSGSPSPASINYIPGTGSNTITQQQHNLKTVIFCIDWGKCDGSTDDTSSWNNMVSAVQSTSVVRVVIANKTTVLNNPNFANNLDVECINGATIKNISSATTRPINITFLHNWTLNGCVIDDNGAQITGGNNALVYLQGDTNFKFTNNTLINSGVNSASTGGIVAYQNNGGDISGNTITNLPGTGIVIDNGTPNQFAIAASTLIGTNASDNMLWIQAATPGSSGNSQTVTIVNDGANQPLSFTQQQPPFGLTIHLATDSSGNSTSTAASIISAFNAAPLQQWFKVMARGTGSGIVSATALTTLSGGLSSLGTINVAKNNITGVTQGNGIEVEVGGGSAGTPCNVNVDGNNISNIWDYQDYAATSTLHSGQNGNGIDINNCSNVHAFNNNVSYTDFTGIRIYNGWFNEIGPNNTVSHAGEQSMYAEYNSQANRFHDNVIRDGLFGVNDNNAELRTNLQLNEYINNRFYDIAGSGIVCNACVAKDEYFEDVINGIIVTGGSSGGYNSQIVDNTCVVSQNPLYPKLLNCVGVSSGYGGTDALIQGNHTIGTAFFGNDWGVGFANGTITNVALGNPTTITFSSGTPATGNTVCLYGIPLFSTFQLNGTCAVATVTGSSFTIPVDSTSYAPWVATVSPANPGSANGWRFTSFWYMANPAVSPASFNSHILVRDEEFKDSVKGTPKVNSYGTIPDDDCNAGVLSNIGSGSGTHATYMSTGWVCGN